MKGKNNNAQYYVKESGQQSKKMNKPSSASLHAIDTQPLNNFKDKLKKRLSIPECILEEYSFSYGTEMNDNQECSPTKQYQNAEGYEFTWGHILERRTGAYIVWDFCFVNLLTQYLQSGKRLSDLQRAVYSRLERTTSCVTRDIVPVLSMEEGWKIVPTSSVGVFTLIINFTLEEEARKWVINDLLYQVIPDLIADIQSHDSKEQN